MGHSVPGLSEEAELFLVTMREFGLYEAVEPHLPAEFAAVYEIARVLEDPKHPLTQRLAPILGLTHTPRTAPQESSTLLPLPRHFAAEEYDAELIRHYRDIVHIYPHQFLLPEEIFYHRLAERLLWMPVPHPPQVYGYQTQADIYAPDIRKQKVYLLFDTSASMQTHHRIQLAKAIAYVFLRRNQAELGEIFLRTFDLAVGELHHAYDRPSFERLLRTVLRLQAVGQGTILEQAIRTAVEDIRHRTSLVHSEILVITDGIAYLHVDRVRELLGTDIRLHAVRLGHGQLKLKAKAVEDFVYRDDSEASRLYRKLQDEKRHLERQLVHVSGEQQRRLLQNQLHSLQQQCEALLAQMEQQAYRHYATALQQLCVVYVPVEDMPPSQLVGLPAERREALERAARRLLEQLQHSPTAEDFRTAAVVAEYLSFLSRCCAEAAALQGLAQQLRRHVEQALQEGEYRVAEQRVRLNREERRMLRALGAVSKASLSQLLRWLSVRYWLRRLRAWIQRSVWRLRWRFR